MLTVIRTAGLALTAAAIVTAASAAAGKDDPPPRPKQIDALYACKSIADAGQRLACYDQAVATIQTADTSGDVIFADREQVRRARQGLFGLGNIRLGIFSRGDNDPEDQEIKEIQAAVRSVSYLSDGKLLVVLDDGARWVQTENARIRSRTTEAKTVTIKRGSLGSYTIVFDNGTYMKVKRVF